MNIISNVPILNEQTMLTAAPTKPQKQKDIHLSTTSKTTTTPLPPPLPQPLPNATDNFDGTITITECHHHCHHYCHCYQHQYWHHHPDQENSPQMKFIGKEARKGKFNENMLRALDSYTKNKHTRSHWWKTHKYVSERQHLKKINK